MSPIPEFRRFIITDNGNPHYRIEGVQFSDGHAVVHNCDEGVGETIVFNVEQFNEALADVRSGLGTIEWLDQKAVLGFD